MNKDKELVIQENGLYVYKLLGRQIGMFDIEEPEGDRTRLTLPLFNLKKVGGTLKEHIAMAQEYCRQAIENDCMTTIVVERDDGQVGIGCFSNKRKIVGLFKNEP